MNNCHILIHIIWLKLIIIDLTEIIQVCLVSSHLQQEHIFCACFDTGTHPSLWHTQFTTKLATLCLVKESKCNSKYWSHCTIWLVEVRKGLISIRSLRFNNYSPFYFHFPKIFLQSPDLTGCAGGRQAFTFS